MLNTAKKIIPKYVRHIINNFLIAIQKKLLVRKMQAKHKKLLEGLKGKEKIKVVFLEIFNGMWKADPLFLKMLNDPYFEPLILVCPCTVYNEILLKNEMSAVYNFFKEKKYPVLSSYIEEENRWIHLDEVKPDIIFFNIPHNMTRKEYYDNALMSYLSCYIPYNHDVGVFGGTVNQHNQLFHNVQWKIFTPHECSFSIYKRFSAAKGRNVVVTGYPPMEPFFCKQDINKKSSWNNFDGRKRIIWAPHHTIDVEYLPFSNFLIYADEMLKLAEKYSNKIFWSFKPHPELRYKLYKYHAWGKKKTDLYYKKWEDSSFSQLDQGEYVNLFMESDAMIHDCGSFLAEYMYVKKPVLYMLNVDNNLSYYNSFGRKALKACRIGNNKEDIEFFIQNLLNEDFFITDEHRTFYENEILKYFNKTTPSSMIISILKNDLGEEKGYDTENHK